MRYLLPVLLAFAAACSSSGGSSSSTGSSGSTGSGGSSGTGGSSGGSDCFDYTGFDTTSPTVSFKSDVVPIFSQSCALSTACHSCDNQGTPGCTTGGYKPFLGIGSSDGTATSAQLAAILSATVGQPAALQVGTVDSTPVGDPSLSIIEAGDPAKSFITYKLDATFLTEPTDGEVDCSTLACASTQTCGQAMPSGGPALAASERDTIRRWIAQGALNN